MKREEVGVDSLPSKEMDDLLAGHKLGIDLAIRMMRSGNLRLAPLPFEVGKRPYDNRFRPVKATLLIWREWWKDRRVLKNAEQAQP